MNFYAMLTAGSPALAAISAIFVILSNVPPFANFLLKLRSGKRDPLAVLNHLLPVPKQSSHKTSVRRIMFFWKFVRLYRRTLPYLIAVLIAITLASATGYVPSSNGSLLLLTLIVIDIVAMAHTFLKCRFEGDFAILDSTFERVLAEQSYFY